VGRRHCVTASYVSSSLENGEEWAFEQGGFRLARLCGALSMSTEFETANPYVSPAYTGFARQERESASGSILAAALALMAVAGIGLALSLFNFAMSFGEARIDPNAPEIVREFQRGTVGPVATAMQGGFAMLNLFIIVCGVQMVKLKSWGMGVAGSVLSMLNFGSCCCALGMPVGIFSLIVLMNPNTISIFSAAAQQEASLALKP
jgi:hypothetical protein